MEVVHLRELLNRFSPKQRETFLVKHLSLMEGARVSELHQILSRQFSTFLFNYEERFHLSESEEKVK